MRILVIVIIAALALVSCDQTTKRRLADAAALVDRNPDTALAVLDSIDRKLLSGCDEAIFGLLYTGACIRTGRHIIDDSLITVAADFFETEGNYGRAAEARYYKARLLFEADDYRRAIVELRCAAEMADTAGNQFLNGKICELFADIYHLSCNLAEAIPYREKAVKYFKQLNRHDLYYYAVVDLATACLDCGEYQKGIDLLSSTDIGQMSGDSVFVSSYNLIYTFLNDASGNHRDALEKYRAASKFMTDEMKPFVNYAKIARVFINNAMPDSALYYMNLAAAREKGGDSLPDGHLLEAKCLYFEQKGLIDSAYVELKRHFEIYNDKAGVILNQSVALSDRDYYSRKSSKQRIKAEKDNRLFMLLISFVLLSMISLALYYRHRITVQRRRFNEQIVDIRSMLDEIRRQKEALANENQKLNSRNDLAEQKLASLNESIESLFNDNFKSLGNICDEYFEFRDSDRVQTALMNRFKHEIATLQSDRSFEKIESTVNQCRDNIIGRIRQQMPRFKEIDIRIIALVLAGFSPRTICLLCDLTLGNYYNKRTRLKARIAASDAPDKDIFLRHLG